jgi:hypothetical protein
LKIDAYKVSLLEGNHEAIATNDAMLRCPAAFVRDLQTFFGENDDGLKSRAAGREFALDVDDSSICFRVHVQSTPAQ